MSSREYQGSKSLQRVVRVGLRALVVGFVLLPLTAGAQTSASAAADSVGAVVTSLAAHYQSGDLDAAGMLFAEGRGVHIIEGAGANHGWIDYRDHHLGPELKAFKNFMYSVSAVEPTVIGEAGYAAFRYELSADTKSGKIASEGRGTAVMRRTPAGWRIVHMHTSGRRR